MLFAFFHMSGVMALVAVCTLWFATQRQPAAVQPAGQRTGEDKNDNSQAVNVLFVIESPVTGARRGHGVLRKDKTRGVCGHAVTSTDVGKARVLRMTLREYGSHQADACTLALEKTREHEEDGVVFAGCSSGKCSTVWERCAEGDEPRILVMRVVERDVEEEGAEAYAVTAFRI